MMVSVCKVSVCDAQVRWVDTHYALYLITLLSLSSASTLEARLRVLIHV